MVDSILHELNGKTALITGGARGIGARTARRFVEAGAQVVIADTQGDLAAWLVRDLGESRARAIHLDVTEKRSWALAIGEVESAFGPIDILVNHADLGIPTSLATVSEAEYRRVMDINQIGVFLGMQAALPSLKKSGGGSIMNTSSIHGIHADLGSFATTASKFAVRGMTKSAAIDLAPFGIRVNAVYPGRVKRVEPDLVDLREYGSMMSAPGLSADDGLIDDVAKLLTFLGSDASSSITGGEYVVDEGVILFNETKSDRETFSRNLELAQLRVEKPMRILKKTGTLSNRSS